jgi:hypothetical protein
MPVSVMIFYTRRPDHTPTEFRKHMEDIHVPLVKEVIGVHYPTTYSRKYVERVESGAGDRLGAPAASRKNTDPTTPVLLVGSPSEWTWDMIGTLVFRDELHLQQCFAMMNHPEGQKIQDDEEHFTILHQMKVVLMGEDISA